MSMTDDEFAARIQQKWDASDEGVPPPPLEVDTEEGQNGGEVAETPDAATGSETPDEDTQVADSADEAAQQAEDELPDDATPEEIEAARLEAEEQFYAGRYKTREEAEAGIAQKDSTIGRMGQELGQLRAALAEQQAEKEAAEAVPEINPREWEEWAAQAVEQGAGQQGALSALQTGGYAGYEIYMKEWMRDPEQLPDAIAFNNGMMIELTEARAKSAAEPVLQERARATAQEDAEWARDQAVKTLPGFVENEERMDAVIASLPPEEVQFLRALANEGRGGKLKMLQILNLHTIASSATSQERAQQVEAARRRASGDAAKVGATVASAEARNARTPLTEAELQKIQYVNARRKEWGQELLPEE